MVYGITGGTGSGKTTVTDYLKKLGYTVIDADQIARDIAEPGSALLWKLAEEFGADIIAADGTLLRKKLGSIVFSDKERLDKLNSIMAPALDTAFGSILGEARLEHPYSKIFFDAPTLIESHREYLVDKIWVVAADTESRIKRIMERDGLTREQVIERMSNQLTDEEKIKRADVIIYNNGTLADLEEQVNAALKL